MLFFILFSLQSNFKLLFENVQYSDILFGTNVQKIKRWDILLKADIFLFKGMWYFTIRAI